MRKLWVLAGALLCITACSARSTSPPSASREVSRNEDARVVIAWNERIFEAAIAEDGLLTLKGLRTASMAHLAIHDGLNAIDSRYETYLPFDARGGGDPVAAAASAAHAIAVDQYPDRRDLFDAELATWLAGVEDAAARNAGAELGRTVAERILAQREDDGWDGEAEYQWHPMGPGVYAEFAEHGGTPEGFIFGAGWAAARPFALESPSQFRAPLPPDIESAEYAEAFDEVKEVGRDESATRTADQAHLAMWWKDFAENSHNRLARQLASEEAMNLWTAARMFALVNLAIYDAYVNVFENKFHYNHWRPYTAIRWAANDGNPDTEPEPDWNNLHRHTYAFPSYPSAHGTACTAAMTAIADTLGDDYSFTMTTAEVDQAGPFSGKVAMEPPTRKFESFSAAAMECALSRVYLGIHFRYDSEAGFELGRRIGEHVVREVLRPTGSD